MFLPPIGQQSKYKPGDHLLDFLSKSKGNYVDQGTYSIGLQYQISDGKKSPFSYVTLSSMERSLSEEDKSIFVKLVPLTQEIPIGQYKDIKDEVLGNYDDWLLYLDETGNVKQAELREELENEGDEKGVRIPVVGTSRTEDYIDYSKFRGFNWNLFTREDKRYEYYIDSTYIHNFVAEIESQIQIFKMTNGDLSSFVLPIYESIIVDKTDLRIIDTMKKHFSYTQGVNANLFDHIKEALEMSEYFKLGVIVMPMMSIPPMTKGWSTLLKLGLYYDSNYDKLALENISKKDGNNYLLYHSDTTDGLDNDKRKGIFIITQMVYYMIKLLELGKIHGDVHPGNILIHPELPNTTQCFKDGTMEVDTAKSHYLSTVFLLDFGTVRESPKVIPQTNQFESFIEKIKLLLVTPGTHGFSPLLKISAYDWFVALFLKRDTDGKYKLLNGDIAPIDYDTLVHLDHDKYFINENFITLFDMIENFKKGNDSYIEKSNIKLGRIDSSIRLPLIPIRGGNGGQMDLMAKNLYNGERTLQMLKEQIGEARGHVTKNSMSSKQLKSKSRKGKPITLFSFFEKKKKRTKKKKERKKKRGIRTRSIRTRSAVY